MIRWTDNGEGIPASIRRCCLCGLGRLNQVKMEGFGYLLTFHYSRVGGSSFPYYVL